MPSCITRPKPLVLELPTYMSCVLAESVVGRTHISMVTLRAVPVGNGAARLPVVPRRSAFPDPDAAAGEVHKASNVART